MHPARLLELKDTQYVLARNIEFKLLCLQENSKDLKPRFSGALILFYVCVTSMSLLVPLVQDVLRKSSAFSFKD